LAGEALKADVNEAKNEGAGEGADSDTGAGAGAGADTGAGDATEVGVATGATGATAALANAGTADPAATVAAAGLPFTEALGTGTRATGTSMPLDHCTGMRKRTISEGSAAPGLAAPASTTLSWATKRL
jgi:hypothetical protein